LVIFILIVFSFSSTKFEQYITPFYIPFLLILSFGVCESYRAKNFLLLLSSLVVFINTTSYAVANAVYSGETEISLTSTLLNIFGSYKIISVFIFLSLIFLFTKNKKELFAKTALFLIFVFSLLFPLQPNRNILAKKIGLVISENEEIKEIFVADYFRQYNFDVVLSYYVFPAQVEYMENRNYVAEREGSGYCIVNRPDYDRYKNISYDFFPCRINKTE